MADLDKLNTLIKKSGIKLTHIAKQCNVCRQTLYFRLIGKSEFTKHEIDVIAKTLHMSPKLKHIIFDDDTNKSNL